MPDDFPQLDSPELPRKRLRQPLDYRSRNTKLRLFGAVAMLILVLALAERARDPASWNWLFGLKSKTEKVDAPIDNRLARTEAAAEEPETVFPTSAGAASSGEKQGESAAPSASPVQEAWINSWKSIWRDLGSDERTLLFRLVEAGEDAKPLQPGAADPDAASRADRVLSDLHKRWETQQAAAFQEISSLGAEDQARWVETLRQVNARWAPDGLHKALQIVALNGTVSEPERKAIARFGRDLVQICLTQVRDDAAFLRPDENQLWFHLLHELQTTSPENLSAKSAGITGFGAMYNQPEAYRGKVVTVKAQVRWAYRVPAINNHLGISEFNVLYLATEEVPDKPLIVYALGLPQGFPPLQNQDETGAMTKLYEDVVVTGYFFKRGAYRGKDANYTAPLLLANTPHWIPSKGTKDTTARGREIWREALIVSAVLFCVAALVVFIATRLAAKKGPRMEDEEARAAVGKLQSSDLGPSLSESLKRLAEEDSRDAK